MLGWVGVSGAVPLTARVDFAEVYSKCALSFTSGESGGAASTGKPAMVPGCNGIHGWRGGR